jgi:hypothetical protein
MRWEQQATGLNITIENPLIILKDRQYLAECLRIDLGKIKLTNTTQESKERWLSNPEKKVNTTTMRFNFEAMRVDHM